MSLDLSKNYFELFRLPTAYAIDLAALERAFRDVQREVHPDRYAQAGDTEQRLAAQWATQVNEAYRILKSPLARARYFLKINGIDTKEETNTAMPRAFLMQQMEWREAVAEAKAARNMATLETLDGQRRGEEQSLLVQLARQLAYAGTMPSASETVRKLRFLEKLGEEIEDAQSSLEA